jgi:hypothetical protein
MKTPWDRAALRMLPAGQRLNPTMTPSIEA